MIGLLQAILCVLRNLVLGVLWALLELVNLLVLAIGAFGAFLLGLLPAMPTPPTWDQPEALGWLAWGVPVAGILTALGVFIGLYLVILVVRVGLRWVKAM